MKKENILLISLPNGAVKGDYNSSRYVFPPMGLLCLADRCAVDYVDKVEILDFNLFDYSSCATTSDYENLIRKELLRISMLVNFNIVGISVMFSSSHGFFTIVSRMVRETLKNSVIVCGGIHATNVAGFILGSQEEIDYVICGEAENAFPKLIENIASNNFKSIPGVHSKQDIQITDNGKPIVTKPVEDIDIDYNKYKNALDVELYANNTSLFSLSKTDIQVKSFAIMASRGCPMHCVFCAAHTVHGHKPRWRSVENVRDEIMNLYENNGVSKFYLMDDNFVPKSKTLELFDMLSTIQIPDFEVVIQNMSVNHTDFDIIDSIARAKINYIPLAIETGSAEMQKKIKKYCDLDKAVELIKYTRAKGLNVRCFYIIGFPNETIEQMNETIDFALKAGADWSTFSVAVPLPGTEMYDQFMTLGYIEDTPDSWGAATIRDRVFDTAEISANTIIDMAYEANLKINFINNIQIREGKYDDARIIFSNFIQSFGFHIFAHDALRRIYRLSHDFDNERKELDIMKHLLMTDDRSLQMMKYSHLLDEDARGSLLEGRTDVSL
jgi:radical SAM superfamily enzyme YgiQ (UPF0313 family)